MKLTKEEREILASVERGEWKTAPGFDEDVKKYQEYAKATLRKNKRVNIRISEKDLMAIKKHALKEGLPYQTLISSILHKFATGRLMEKRDLE